MINVLLLKTSLPLLLRGAFVSLQIAGLSFLIGMTCGTLLGVLQSKASPPIRALISAFVTLIRGTPMIVQIVFINYVIPMMGLHLSAFFAAVCAIGLNSSAYISQIIKSGISSVGKGQIEAAQTLGLSKVDTLRFIVLPQAVRVVLPTLGNEGITLIKDSSLASWIGVVELYKEGQTIISQTYDALTIYCALAIIYLAMTTSVAYCVGLLERRMNRHVRNL
jgi:His/Glu/Gln/Arg/opine family amino acid ABC transporter permease subunit